MDEILKNEGFQHIASIIFDNLDVKSILRCREVNTTWAKKIDKDKILWKRRLQKLKIEKFYPNEDGEKMTILNRFPEWHRVFEFYENQVDTADLKNFVVALESPCNYMRNWNTMDLYPWSPVHLEATRGRHKLIRLFLDTSFPWDLDAISMDFNEMTNPDRKFTEPNLLNIAFDNDDFELVQILLSDN